jgi:hypothetical protein
VKQNVATLSRSSPNNYASISCEVGKRESDVAVTPWVIVIVGMTVKNDIAIPQPISLGIPFINLL